MKTVQFLFAAFSAICVASPAHAYIGPGAGLGAIAITIALGLGILLLVFGLVWYPLKRMLKGKSGSVAADEEAGKE